MGTTIPTKGQVILPKAIRDQRQWKAGTRLVVENTAEGVLLKAAPAFAPTHPKDVFASLAYQGTPKTLEEMDFADALHLAKAQGCDAFVSFDRCFARAANRLGAITARAP